MAPPPGPAAEEPSLAGRSDTSLPTKGLDGAALVAQQRGPDGEALAPGSRVGRYVILSPLGVGGEGVVYAAFDPTLGRRIAIKLRAATDTEAQRRLLREAQAMALLSHANVLPVYDSGVLGERVFVAVEYMDGGTLRQWLAASAEPRPVKDVLAMFIAAGRGLAEAHRAGLVHRDFKPDNVLLDGALRHVRVGDFGLVQADSTQRTGPTPNPQDPGGDLEGLGSTSQSALATPLTQVGAVMGTPRYMAPEQHRGGRTDARTDQFSFCVALYEALAGGPPFPGTRVRERLAAVEEGHLEPGSRPVPRWILPVLQRGLRAKPEDRYPSMDALLAALQKDPTQQRRRLAWGALAMASAAAVAVGIGERGRVRERECRAEGAAIASGWNASRAAEVRGAFERSGVASSRLLFEHVDEALGKYAREWSTVAEQSCRATHVDRSQTEALYERRRKCLDQRRAELSQLATLLVAADARLIRKSVEAAADLSSLESCSDARTLLSPVEPPKDGATAAAADAMRRTLAEAKAMTELDSDQTALDRATAVVTQARVLGYGPVLAEALLVQGRATIRGANDPTRAAAQLEESFHLALAARAMPVAAEAGVYLTRVLGHLLGKREDGHLWGRLALSAAGSEGSLDADDVRMRVAIFETYIYDEEEQSDLALASARRGMELAERRHGGDPPILGRAHAALGVAFSTGHHLAEARQEFEQALRLTEGSLGPDHPRVASHLNNMAAIVQNDGRPAEAVRLLDRALTINESVFGPRNLEVEVNLLNRAEALRDVGRLEDALADYRRTREMILALYGPNHEDLVNIGAGSAACLHKLRREDEAEVAFAEAERVAALSPPAKRVVAELAYVKGELLWERGGAHERARALVQSARDQLAAIARRPVDRVRLAEVDRWLEEHGGEGRRREGR